MECMDCPFGKRKQILGNGITEPPYIGVVKCPFDDVYYKNYFDDCSHEEELKKCAKRRE